MSEEIPPAGVQQHLGAAGACPEIEWGGKTWRVGHPVQKARAALEELVAAKAVAETRALEGILDPAAYDAAQKDCLRAIRAGECRTWGAQWVATVNGPDGDYLFLMSLIKPQHPDATEADVSGLMSDRGFELAAALERVCPAFFTELAAARKGATARQRQEIADQFTARLLPAFRRLLTPTS